MNILFKGLVLLKKNLLKLVSVKMRYELENEELKKRKIECEVKIKVAKIN